MNRNSNLSYMDSWRFEFDSLNLAQNKRNFKGGLYRRFAVLHNFGFSVTIHFLKITVPSFFQKLSNHNFSYARGQEQKHTYPF